MAKRPKPQRRFPPEVLSDEEVKRLLQVCPATPSGERTKALLVMLYRGGLRVSEALSLRPKDLDLEQGCVRVLFGKGGRSRTVGIDPGAVDTLRAWLAVRACLGVDGKAPVFCTRSGRATTPAYLRRLFPVLARRAGVEKRVHAHGLRHTHAAQLRAEGLDIGIISKQLGHVNIGTTVRYLDHINPTAVIEAIQRRAWCA
jgi:site-specific recombinase XerD